MTTPIPKLVKDDSKPKVQSLIFEALEVDGSNYLEWSIDTKTYLTAEGLQNMIKSKKEDREDISASEISRALMVIRRHIDNSLRRQYLTIDKPAVLWKELKTRFLHKRTIHLP